MIIVYARVTDDEIRSGAVQAIADIKAWFKANPKRRVCNADCWYGRRIKVRRDYVCEDVEAARDQALGSNHSNNTMGKRLAGASLLMGESPCPGGVKRCSRVSQRLENRRQHFRGADQVQTERFEDESCLVGLHRQLGRDDRGRLRPADDPRQIVPRGFPREVPRTNALAFGVEPCRDGDAPAVAGFVENTRLNGLAWHGWRQGVPSCGENGGNDKLFREAGEYRYRNHKDST